MRQIVLAVRLVIMAALASAADIVYVTDLSIFTELAPCVASAVGNLIQAQTYSNCPEAVTELQGCVCTKNNNFASISKAISSSVSSRCGGTATEDQASAATVLSAYCNQETSIDWPKPEHTVTQHITEIAEIGDLAPCASSALSYVVLSMSYTYCPEEASAFAPCVCQKNQNSLKVSQLINTSVKSSCSAHSADITSAQAMFAAYCGMVSGTTSFPKASAPPGDVSYYITGLPQFSSLAPCAQTAVSYAVGAQTWDFCPKGPQALASCACIKESMFGSISSTLTSNVKYECGATASEDVKSGLSVLDYFCSAAKAQVTPAGVTESILQTYATAESGSGSGSPAKETGSSTGTRGPQSTGGSSGNGSTDGGDGGSSSGGSRTGIIAGAAAGSVLGIALLGTLVFCVMRQVRRRRADDAVHFQPAVSAQGSPPSEFGKPELGGLAVGAPPSPSPSAQKQSAWARADDVSPASAPHSAYPNSPYSPDGPQPPPPSHAGYAPHHAPELYGQPVYQADSQPVGPQRAELSGMGWQAGPVANYAELDGGQHWRGEPHAR